MCLSEKMGLSGTVTMVEEGGKGQEVAGVGRKGEKTRGQGRKTGPFENFRMIEYYYYL